MVGSAKDRTAEVADSPHGITRQSHTLVLA